MSKKETKKKSIEDLEKHIEFLKKRISGTNSSVEKAVYESQIKDLRTEIESMRSSLGDKKVSTQIDAPSVSERTQNESIMLTRGQVMDSGNMVSMEL